LTLLLYTKVVRFSYYQNSLKLKKTLDAGSGMTASVLYLLNMINLLLTLLTEDTICSLKYAFIIIGGIH